MTLPLTHGFPITLTFYPPPTPPTPLSLWSQKNAPPPGQKIGQILWAKYWGQHLSSHWSNCPIFSTPYPFLSSPHPKFVDHPTGAQPHPPRHNLLSPLCSATSPHQIVGPILWSIWPVRIWPVTDLSGKADTDWLAWLTAQRPDIAKPLKLSKDKF